MTIGILEVELLDARGLHNADFLGGMDPYVLLQYKTQEHKSSVARAGQGRNPVWNEKFTFRVEYPGGEGQYKLVLKIMDKDTFSADDFVGQTSIYLEDLLALGVENGKSELHPCKYRVVQTDQTYCGEIRVGINFTPKVHGERDGIEIGGWRESGF